MHGRAVVYPSSSRSQTTPPLLDLRGARLTVYPPPDRMVPRSGPKFRRGRVSLPRCSRQRPFETHANTEGSSHDGIC